jgi:hypothetical protein
MGGRLWVDVPKGGNVIVFVYDVCGNFPGDNFREYGGHTLLASII